MFPLATRPFPASCRAIPATLRQSSIALQSVRFSDNVTVRIRTLSTSGPLVSFPDELDGTHNAFSFRLRQYSERQANKGQGVYYASHNRASGGEALEGEGAEFECENVLALAVYVQKISARMKQRQPPRRITAATTTSFDQRRSLRTASFSPLFHRQFSTIPTGTALTFVEQLLEKQNAHHRSMVTVVQTKAADLEEETEDFAISSPQQQQQPQYTVHSEALIVTPSCLKRVEQLLAKKRNNDESDADSSFLRVYVDAGGCSGFQYRFELDDELDLEDNEDGDVVLVSAATDNSSTSIPRIVSDVASLELLEGSTLDYVQEMIKSSFVVKDNPQSESACGCGSSFAKKNFAVNPAMD